jgi:hypothetical protein
MYGKKKNLFLKVKHFPGIEAHDQGGQIRGIGVTILDEFVPSW